MAKLSPDEHLSGSVLPAYMGFSPYQNAYDVLDRARDAIEGKPRPELDSLPADVGTVIEPIILRRGLEALGLDPDLLYHHTEEGEEAAKKHDDIQLYYSDDGIIDLPEPITIRADHSKNIEIMNNDGEMRLDGKVILEAKFTSVPRKHDDPPLYRGPIQLQAGMMCHNADYGILFTCYQGRDIHIHVFGVHQSTQQMILEAVLDFESHIATGTYPDPVDTDQMARKYSTPAEEEIDIDLDADLVQAVDTYQQAVATAKHADKEKHDASLALMAALGENKKGKIHTDSGRTIQVAWPWRTTKAKPAQCCPECGHELIPAKEESTSRQKTISIKELLTDE